MEFLHNREHLRRGDTVVVDCSHQSNIVMTDDVNFQKYKNRKPFDHAGGGGFFKLLPASLIVPWDGFWNVTIDLNGNRATITHSITIVRAT